MLAAKDVARLAVDPEAPTIRRALVGATRDGYRAAFASWRVDAARAWRAAGARYIEVVDDEVAERAVRRIVGTAGQGVDA